MDSSPTTSVNGILSSNGIVRRLVLVHQYKDRRGMSSVADSMHLVEKTITNPAERLPVVRYDTYLAWANLYFLKSMFRCTTLYPRARRLTEK